MRRLNLVLSILALCGSGAVAYAQSADHPGVCPSYERAWERVARTNDSDAMRAALAGTDTACPGLRRRMQARIAAGLGPARRPQKTTAASSGAPRPADPPPRGGIPAAVRAVLTPAAYSNLERETQKALPYFRPNTLQRREYSEAKMSAGGGRNQSCALRFFPRDTRNATTSETVTTKVRASPYVEWVSIRARHVNCFLEASSPYQDAGKVDLSLLHISAVVTAAQFPNEFGADNLQLTANLDPGSADRRNVTFAGHDSSGTCTETRRWRAGEWNANFPYILYEMRCDFTKKLMVLNNMETLTVTASGLFSPELSADLSCGLRSESRMSDTRTETTVSNIQVFKEGDAVHVKCATQTLATSSAGLMRMRIDTKTEVEDVITLD